MLTMTMRKRSQLISLVEFFVLNGNDNDCQTFVFKRTDHLADLSKISLSFSPTKFSNSIYAFKQDDGKELAECRSPSTVNVVTICQSGTARLHGADESRQWKNRSFLDARWEWWGLTFGVLLNLSFLRLGDGINWNYGKWENGLTTSLQPNWKIWKRTCEPSLISYSAFNCN